LFIYRYFDRTTSFFVEDLREPRARVANRVRAIRRERGWTRAVLGERLGLAQARLSEIERGDGSFSAEQLLMILDLFNVPISEFLPASDADDELQNALIRFGAIHLRQVPGGVASGRTMTPDDAILATLVGSRSSRLVTALAPVLVHPPWEMGALDLFDPTIRSDRTREIVWSERASAISRRWRIVSELQPDDFGEALRSACGRD
jgi:DNA-binding XRE family transcriptional regulator